MKLWQSNGSTCLYLKGAREKIMLELLVMREGTAFDAAWSVAAALAQGDGEIAHSTALDDRLAPVPVPYSYSVEQLVVDVLLRTLCRS